MAYTHLIAGAGNMGGALLSGWLDSGLLSPRNLVILDPSPGGEAVYAIERGAKHASGPADVPESVGTILLAVKPQLFPQIRRKLADAVADDALVISIMAGLSMASLQRTFPEADVVRAMPNTPASLGKGVTAYAAPRDLSAERVTSVETLLGATGTVLRVADDMQIDAVTAVSGSGPAYVFHMCEALAKAAQSVGLPPDVAAALARQTLIGASGLLEASDRSPTELREAVTSPGGTTQAALDILMASSGMEPLMQKAVQAAFDRACELSL
ncbi:MAG: pyrroline-5-carboxylate reductase [Pseudomonadota bacterium]